MLLVRLQKFCERCDRLLRILFHQPVTRILENDDGNVLRDRARLRGERDAIAFIAADRENGHSQLRCG